MNWFIETMDVYGHTVLHNDPIVAAELRTARAAVTTAGVRTPVYGHTALHNDPVIAAQLREAQNAKSTVVHTHMRGSGGRLNYNDTSVMQAMSKRLRALQRSTLSRKDRSAVYDDAVLLIDSIYDKAAFGGREHRSDWSTVRSLLPRRGTDPSGGKNIVAGNLWRILKLLHDDPKGRANALMLIVKAAKTTSALGQSHMPFLRAMSQVLDFALEIAPGSTGMQDHIDVSENGIVVRPARGKRERLAAQALVELAA